MSNATRPYDIAHYYDNILRNIHSDSPESRKYWSKPDEPSINEEAKKLIQYALDRQHEIIYQIVLLEQCFDYEIKQYDNKTNQSDIEKHDRETCHSLRWQLWNIEQSFRKSSRFFKCIEDRMNQHNFAASSNVLKAVKHSVKKQTERCKNIFKQCLMDYVLKSIFRPYYIYHLSKHQIHLTDDIKEHTLSITPHSYEELIEKFEPYIQHIADYAEQSGKTNYKDIRMEEYDKMVEKRQKIKESKKQEQQEKRQQQFEERLHKFCIQKEQSYYNQRNIKQKTIQIATHITKQSNYDKNARNCCAIACLCKPEKGTSYFRYYDKTSLQSRITSINTFFFDNKDLAEALEHAKTLPDVKAVDSILIY